MLQIYSNSRGDPPEMCLIMSDLWHMLLENVGSTTELVLFSSLASRRNWFVSVCLHLSSIMFTYSKDDYLSCFQRGSQLLPRPHNPHPHPGRKNLSEASSKKRQKTSFPEDPRKTQLVSLIWISNITILEPIIVVRWWYCTD